jgi:hypothetical protein
LASHLHGDNVVLGKYIEFMIARTDWLMKSPEIWAQVEAVAAAFLARRMLTSSEVREICQEVKSDGTRIRELRAELMARDRAEQEIMARKVPVE